MKHHPGSSQLLTSSIMMNLVSTRVSTGRDVPRDVPGQTGTGRTVVPLSRDKIFFLSRCPFVPGQGQEQMSRDGTVSKNPGPSRPVARFWACPVVPLSRDKEGISVPLSRKVALSRPVGNANLVHIKLIQYKRFFKKVRFVARIHTYSICSN